MERNFVKKDEKENCKGSVQGLSAPETANNVHAQDRLYHCLH